MYRGGRPPYSIEKPMVLRPGPFLGQIQESGDYYGELKLDEDRGFIALDAVGNATFYSYRNQFPTKLEGPVLDQIKAMNLPPYTVFDGGKFSRVAWSRETRLWIFDILELDGQRLRLPFRERMALRNSLIVTGTHIWLPLGTATFVHEFENMIQGRSALIKEGSLTYGIPYDLFKGCVEGLVVKNLNSKPSFPGKVKEVASFFKLRLVDV